MVQFDFTGTNLHLYKAYPKIATVYYDLKVK